MSSLLLIPSAINSYRRNNTLWTLSNNLIVVSSFSPFIEFDRLVIYLIGLSYVKSPVLILVIPFLKDLRMLARLSFTCGVTKSLVDFYPTKYFEVLLFVWSFAIISYLYIKSALLWHFFVSIGLFISSYKEDGRFIRRSRGKYTIRY